MHADAPDDLCDPTAYSFQHHQHGRVDRGVLTWICGSQGCTTLAWLHETNLLSGGNFIPHPANFPVGQQMEEEEEGGKEVEDVPGRLSPTLCGVSWKPLKETLSGTNLRMWFRLL